MQVAGFEGSVRPQHSQQGLCARQVRTFGTGVCGGRGDVLLPYVNDITFSPFTREEAGAGEGTCRGNEEEGIGVDNAKAIIASRRLLSKPLLIEGRREKGASE